MPQLRQRRLLNWWEALPPLARLLAIALAAPLLVLNAWAVFAIFSYFHSLIVVLAAASLIAFLLNYPVSYMQKQGANRERAAVIVFLFALSVIAALAVTLLPVALNQARELVLNLPRWIEQGRIQLIALSDWVEDRGMPVNLDAVALQILDRVREQLQVITGEVFNLAIGTISGLLDLLLTIVLSFYLLQHGDRLWVSLIEWLPTRTRQPFSQTLRLSFQNFFIGQLILATCMASALIFVFLVFLKVPFGLLFGLSIGVMALVPFGGTVGIILVTLLVTLKNAILGLKLFLVAFAVQQVIEQLIAPRILGRVTGLNPVWVLISVLTGARVAGLLGVIVAVPTAVIIKSALIALRSRPSLVEAGYVTDSKIAVVDSPLSGKPVPTDQGLGEEEDETTAIASKSIPPTTELPDHLA